MQNMIMSPLAAIQRARDALHPWLDWWFAELRATWHDALDRLMPSARTLTIVRENNGALEFTRPSSGSVSTEDHASATAGELDTDKLKGSRAVVMLGERDVLTKRLTLPAAVESKLRETLRLRLDREMPLRADAVYFDAAIVARDRSTSRIDVELAIAKRDTIESWEERLLSLGLRAAAIGFGEGSGRLPRFNFLPQRLAAAAVATHRLDRPLMAACIALAAVLVVTVSWQWRIERERVTRELDSISAAASSAQATRQKLIEQVEVAKELRAHLDRAPLAATLEELTQGLGPDVWLHALQMRGSEVLISGTGPNPAGLAGQLEQSALFDRASLKSTTSAGLGTGQDRFDLSLHTSGRPQ